MGNTYKPPLVKFMEDAVWCAIIKVYLGQSAEHAFNELRDTWRSSWVKEQFPRDAAAEQWYSDFQSESLALYGYLHRNSSPGQSLSPRTPTSPGCPLKSQEGPNTRR